MADTKSIPALKSMWDQEPEMMQDLEEEIDGDLEHNYDYGPAAFPSHEGLETFHQRKQRLEMVEEWLKSQPTWTASKTQKINILSALFYCIWNAKQKATRISSGTQYSGVSRQQEHKIFNSDASDHHSNPQSSSSRALGKVDPKSVTQYMLQKVNKWHSLRYGQFIRQQSNLESLLLQCLRKEVLDVCGKEEVQLSDLLSIAGDIQSGEPGIYMHIIWDPKQPTLIKYYLYVGQSQSIRERLKRHENPWNRAKNPSLHYHCWKPGMESIFVVLGHTRETSPLFLNLLELLCCLIFQTLQSRGLEKYLLPGTAMTGCHLNIANPLWQSFSEITSDNYERKDFFGDLLQGADALVKDYYRSLAGNFHALKQSPDPELYGYWHAAHHRSQVGSSAAKVRRTLASLMGGTEKLVSVYKENLQRITFGYVNFRIGKQQVSLKDGTYIHAQGFLSQGPNPNRYALDAYPADPAIRFCIKVAGFDSSGQPFECFLSRRGETTVKDINTLVDRIEGESVEAIATKPRRLVPSSCEAGRITRSYT